MKLLAIRAAHACLDLAGKHARKRWKETPKKDVTPKIERLCYAYVFNVEDSYFGGCSLGADFKLEPRFKLVERFPDGSKSED